MKFFVTWLKEIGHFFAFDYSPQIPVLKIEFFISHWNSDFVKNKTNKTKTTRKKQYLTSSS